MNQPDLLKAYADFLLQHHPEKLRAEWNAALTRHSVPHAPDIVSWLRESAGGNEPEKGEKTTVNAVGVLLKTFLVERIPLFTPDAAQAITLVQALDKLLTLPSENQLPINHYVGQRIADMIPNVLYIYDVALRRQTYTNRKLSRLLGYSREQVREMGEAFLPTVIHPDDYAAFTSLFSRLAGQTDGEIVDAEYRMQTVTGEWLYFYDRATVFSRREDGSVREVLGTLQNITRRKQAEEAFHLNQLFLERVLNTIPDAVFVFDVLQFKIVYVSREIENALGYAPESMYERSASMMRMIIHPEDIARRDAYYRSFADASDNEIRQVEYRLAHANGAWRWFLFRCAVFKRNEDGLPVQIIGSSQDITERKAIEEAMRWKNEEILQANEELAASQAALQKANTSLETIVTERTGELRQKIQELNDANDLLRRVNVDLDNFIYTASHDLKSPVANLEGLLALLFRKLNGKIPDSDHQLVALVDASVGKLKQTIADLAEITRVQKEMDEPTELVDLAALVDDVRTDVRQWLMDANATIITELPVTHLRYVRKNLRSILYNLLTNAVKYRSPERPPVIKISTEKSDPFVKLSVQDNGLGIAPEQMHKLFTMFKRLHTHVEGTGIGLYIIKRIVENRGGRVEVQSRLGEGTTFSVFFRQSTD